MKQHSCYAGRLFFSKIDIIRWNKNIFSQNLNNIKISPQNLEFCITNHRLHKTCLTHWGRVTHICVVKLTIIGSDNGLSPGRRQAIIWTNAGILLIGPLGTNFSEILIGIQMLSFKKMHLKMSSAKWRPFCLGLNELMGLLVADNTRCLTHLTLDKMAAISQKIFSVAFSWMKSSVFWLKFPWSLFLRVQLTITQHWFR